jgi:hypothetical protein
MVALQTTASECGEDRSIRFANSRLAVLTSLLVFLILPLAAGRGRYGLFTWA